MRCMQYAEVTNYTSKVIEILWNWYKHNHHAPTWKTIR